MIVPNPSKSLRPAYAPHTRRVYARELTPPHVYLYLYALPREPSSRPFAFSSKRGQIGGRSRRASSSAGYGMEVTSDWSTRAWGTDLMDACVVRFWCGVGTRLPHQRRLLQQLLLLPFLDSRSSFRFSYAWSGCGHGVESSLDIYRWWLWRNRLNAKERRRW
jgi:hypothetical protein